jgi:glyoxylase-like metal-dependent hydrolase (beta-lactamase superfamily II)
LQPAPGVRIACHCLLLEDERGLALVDTGIGLHDAAHPTERLGQGLIDQAGFRFDVDDTAARRVERLGLARADVRHVVLTHADPDHTGGLADFPAAAVHVAIEELDEVARGRPRYAPAHFAHGPAWRHRTRAAARPWFGLKARPLPLGFDAEVLLVPLPGHTLGHCGVAVEHDGGWLLHVGDAYYLRAELERDDHPASAFAARAAEDDAARRRSVSEVRRLLRDHGDVIGVMGYHDPAELPGALPSPAGGSVP